MATKKAPRKKTDTDVETAVLANSARRCALCFYLNGDLAEKLGQIAHLDSNRSNAAEKNLAFMCLPHHSLFDSTTSQHKNYTIPEVMTARSKLYKLVNTGQHLTPAAAQPYLQNETDKKTLRDLMEMLPSGESISFLRSNDFGAAYRADQMNSIRQFVALCAGPEHEFLDAELEKKRRKFWKHCQTLLRVLGLRTFVIPPEGELRAVPAEWRFEKPPLFKAAVEEIHTAADAVCRAYDSLIRGARKKLSI
jgi:hypothetical protein